jgi:hypothetical protein
VIDKAHDLVKEWKSQRTVDKLVTAEVWTYDSNPFSAVLQELFIRSYQKFASNIGWADKKTPSPGVMQVRSNLSSFISSTDFPL